MNKKIIYSKTLQIKYENLMKNIFRSITSSYSFLILNTNITLLCNIYYYFKLTDISNKRSLN